MEASLLTPLQHDVLEAVFAAGLGECGYYLTGGTALAEFYLNHRYSDDLDLFTRKKALPVEDLRVAEVAFDQLGLDVTRQTQSDQFARFFLVASGSSEGLKVELGRDVGAMMAPPLRLGPVVVDSLEDIAVNKVCAILGREEPKDFCDLYFILTESTFTLDYLIGRAREKEGAFDGEDGILRFAVALLRAKDLPMLPRMVKNLTLPQLSHFLVPEAENLIRRLRPDRG